VERDVLLVVGIGGIGRAVARRQGAGRAVVVADSDPHRLHAAAATLEDDGMDVTTCHVDVSSRPSVAHMAGVAAERGRVTHVVHTAGLSPVQAEAELILRVDLLGVALVLEEVGSVVGTGGAGVVIASMAGHLGASLTTEEEEALASTPADVLLELPVIRTAAGADPGLAYALAKRANQVRVGAASVSWGERGARINSISPGIIATSMGRSELDSESGPFMKAMVEASAARRLGTPQDIASVAAFLLGPDAAFVTGTDVLVDGGAVAALRSGRVLAG
jgi:NAD(P)-dependent dehydrogenase (short-subunit alcohol dehydrogenase family)